MLDKKNLLGVGVTNASEGEVLEYITKNLGKGQEKFFVVTPNPEILVFASKHKEFKQILNRAELALNDGIGLLLASRFLGKPLKARVTGVDLMENLCREVCGKPITVGFLGAGPGVAEMTSKCLRLRYPRLRVAFVGQEWPQNNSKFKVQSSKLRNQAQNNVENEVGVIANQAQLGEAISSGVLRSQASLGVPETEIASSVASLLPRNDIKEDSVNQRLDQHKSAIDILFVAFGFPKQEEWMAANLDRLPIKIAIGVGGAFDYISGNVKRAPKIVRQLGFEWLYRLIKQPWRIKRQLALIEFVYLVLREKLSNIFTNKLIV